jgi:hypothetical protein
MYLPVPTPQEKGLASSGKRSPGILPSARRPADWFGHAARVNAHRLSPSMRARDDAVFQWAVIPRASPWDRVPQEGFFREEHDTWRD